MEEKEPKTGQVETTAVEMTADELAELEAFRAFKSAKAAEEKRKEDLAAYDDLVDEQVKNSIALLRSTSDIIRETKRAVYENFARVLELKNELLRVKEGQRSHTFMSKDGTARVTLGYRCVDAFKDTADAGVEMVKDALSELGTDENAKALVSMVLSLLAKDAMGNLNAQRVLQLQQVAEESGNERIIEGAKIIREAYCPALTKQFVKAEMRDGTNAWKSIPLNMTEA